MPKGIPNGAKQDDLRARIKDIENQIAVLDHRDDAISKLKAFCEKEQLTHFDVLALYRLMKPKRSDEPVKSQKGLRPPGERRSLKDARTNGNGKFMVGPGRTYKGDRKNIRYLSDDGYVWGGLGRIPPWFTQHLKKGGKPQDVLVAGANIGEKHAKKFANGAARG